MNFTSPSTEEVEPSSLVIWCSKPQNVKQTVEKLQEEGLNVQGCVCHVGNKEDRKTLVANTIQVCRQHVHCHQVLPLFAWLPARRISFCSMPRAFAICKLQHCKPLPCCSDRSFDGVTLSSELPFNAPGFDV